MSLSRWSLDKGESENTADISTPLTFPFAIIPIIPNFPLFYVLWRAWSHYKAWRGALYLDQLLQRGMIVEQKSEELDKIYAAKGIVVPPEGAENVAPDSTKSEGVKVKPGSISPSSPSPIDEANEPVVNRHADKIPEQAKGEQPAAPDGTATPGEMVYEPGNDTSDLDAKTPPKGERDGELGEGGSPHVPRDSRILFGVNQVPLLAKRFQLSQLEVIDITRAVEQAQSRLKAAVKAEEGDKAEK